MYLTNEEETILSGVNELLSEVAVNHSLTEEQEILIAKFYGLLEQSKDYTRKCRGKAKQFVQEKRKIDKRYAHKRRTN